MSVYRLPRRMVAVLLVAAAAVVGSQLGASVAVGASGQPAAATGNGPGNPQAVPPSLGPATQCAPTAGYPAATTPVAFWSTEARCAIVPAGPGGVFGPENFGNKFPGEAAVYMGIVHVAIYDAAVAIEGGYQPYAPTPSAPATPRPRRRSRRRRTTRSSACSRARPQPAQQAILDGDYAAYLAAIPDGTAKADGIASVSRSPRRCSRCARTTAAGGTRPSPTSARPLPAPASGNPPPGPVLGLRLPGIRPLALQSASQFRPDGPQRPDQPGVRRRPQPGQGAGRDRQHDQDARADRARRCSGPTTTSGSGTTVCSVSPTARGLDLVQTARMLAMAHVAGGDAMIACFDAKYHYWFWRPYQAIPPPTRTATREPWPTRPGSRSAATPNFPEYPSAHACHSTAVVAALDAFFGTDKIPFSLDSRVTGHRPATYDRLHDVVKDVDRARVLVGFHFLQLRPARHRLGRKVGRYVTDHYFQPIR